MIAYSILVTVPLIFRASAILAAPSSPIPFSPKLMNWRSGIRRQVAKGSLSYSRDVFPSIKATHSSTVHWFLSSLAIL